MGSLGILLIFVGILKVVAVILGIGVLSGFIPVVGDVARMTIGSIFNFGENLAKGIKKSFKKGKKSEK